MQLPVELKRQTAERGPVFDPTPMRKLRPDMNSLSIPPQELYLVPPLVPLRLLSIPLRPLRVLQTLRAVLERRRRAANFAG